MQKTCLCYDWKLTAPGTGGAVPCTLPNDYSITQPRDPKVPGGASNGFFPGGAATYEKFLRFPADASHAILDFDGVYMHADVKCNDNLVGMHHHGYAPFLVDITGKIRPGRLNKLSVRTEALQPSTRWYSGAGIYRDVFLWTGGAVRVEPRDIFVTTPVVSAAHAVVKVSYLIASDVDGEATVEAAVGDLKRTAVVAVKAGTKTPLVLSFDVDSPRLWDTDTPNLYSLHTAITYGGHITDTADTTFGIRSIEADAEHGFRLNGKPMKLRGGCIHHDHGVLGAAAYPAAELRKATLLKQAGFNALRIAHNPPSLALLEVCDRIGLIVMDEAFDMWNSPKGAYDYHLWFGQCWQQDLTAMVLRDRNHPCVICYSIGNEIPESAGISDAPAWSRKLTQEIKKYDDTRFTTIAIWGISFHANPNDPPEYQQDFLAEHTKLNEQGQDVSWPDRTAPIYEPHSLAGYNYLYRRYEGDHKLFPKRVIWGSETHAVNFFDSWHEVLRLSHVIGDFTWTAYDNLGEAGTGRFAWQRDETIKGISLAAYPWRSCYQGDLDLCGYRRPQSYFRESVWLGHAQPRIFTTHPEHYGEGFSGTGWHWYDVLDSWTFGDQYVGKPVLCETYTDADEIEWSLNGRVLGCSTPEKGIARLTVNYEKGTLAAKAIKNGAVVGESSLSTVGAAAKIAVTPEKTQFTADGRDLCYFRVAVQDADGNRIPDAKTALSAQITGGRLLGFASGDPCNEDDYASNACHAFEGRAIAIVSATEPGTVTLTVTSTELAAGTATTAAK